MVLSSKITQDVVLKYDKVPKEQGRQQGKNCIASDSTKTTHFLRFNTRRSKIKKRPNSVKKSCNTFSAEVIHYQIKDIWQLYCKTKN
jgi:hypothetical protein